MHFSVNNFPQAFERGLGVSTSLNTLYTALWLWWWWWGAGGEETLVFSCSCRSWL